MVWHEFFHKKNQILIQDLEIYTNRHGILFSDIKKNLNMIKSLLLIFYINI